MSQWIAVSRSQHANACWTHRQGYHFASDRKIVEVLIPELAKLLPHYVLGFLKQEETWQAVAVLSIGADRNLYINQQGKWLAAYVPALLRSYPFALLDNEAGDKVFCIEQNHLQDPPEGERLFFEDGNLADFPRRALDFLQSCEKGRQTTRAACTSLAEAGLMESWPLKVNRGEGLEPISLEGLYRVNEARLNELDATTFAGLRQHGALLLAYSQLLSTSQIDQLSQRAKYLGKELEAQRSIAGMENLFDDDDSLNFDFLE